MNQFQGKQSNGLRLAFSTLAALFFLTGVSAWAGAFTSTFPAPTPPSGVTLYGSAAILGAGGLQLNQPSQGNSGAAVISDFDAGFAAQSFSLSAWVTTTNGGGNNPADGFGIYFSAPGVVPVGSYQNYENLGVGSGLAMLVSDFSGTISIETGATKYSKSLPSRAVLVGTISVNFSYDQINGAVFTLTGSDNNQYVVSASAAQLAANGLGFQSGDIFTLGGRVGYPGATNADSHTINSLAITTVTTSGGAAPVITSGPSNLTVNVGQTAQFVASISGGQPFYYQWSTNTAADPAGTNANYVLTNAVSADNGMTVQMVVTNNYGSATSGVATLTVTLPGSVTITVNCASNTGTVNPNVWGVGGPDKYIWYAGNPTLEQAVQNAKIKLLRIDPIQNCLYNGRDPYPSANTWNYAGLDAILSTIFASGAQPVFTVCDFPGGVSHSTNSAGAITNADWNAYATFMSGVVSRYNVQQVLGTNNTVHYWEMWNEPELEPDGTFASESVYGQFVQTVGNAMKAVDPTIKLIGPVADYFDTSSSGWISYTAKNLSTQIDILCWHDYGPSASGTSDATYMGWTPLNYQTNMETVTSGDGGLFVGPGGKHYPGAITEYNMSYADNGATFDLKYHDEFNATFAASAIINAMKGGAGLFAFYNLVSSGNDLLGLLANWNYSPYKPYYTFYLFGNYFGDQFVSSTGGASTLECIASKKTAAGTYTVMVVNKDTTGLTYNVNFVLTNIPSASGSVLIHTVNATTDPVSSLGTAAYSNSSFNYSIPPYNVIAFEFGPPPVLQTSLTNGNLTISWNPAAGRLQTSPTLTPPAWTDVTTNNPATILIGSGNAFFQVVVP